MFIAGQYLHKSGLGVLITEITEWVKYIYRREN